MLGNMGMHAIRKRPLICKGWKVNREN